MIDVEALRGHTPGPWKVLQLTREVAVEAPCGRITYCVSRECDAQVEADGFLIASAPSLLAEVIERRARDEGILGMLEAARVAIKDGRHDFADAAMKRAIATIQGAQP